MEHLLNVVVVVDNLNIYDLAILLNKTIVGVDEATIRLDIECTVALQNLCVELGIDLHGILLDQSLTLLFPDEARLMVSAVPQLPDPTMNIFAISISFLFWVKP